MRALVTGAAGFVGSHLCEKLLEDGHTVLGIDDLSNGKLSNLDNIKSNPSFHFSGLDINDHELIPAMQGIDWVFHLAAKADIVPSIEQPMIYHKANVSGTIATLEAARKAQVKRFVYAASSSCYGIPFEYPTGELTPCYPKYPYALTKYLGEQYVMHWGKVYGLPAISLRLFNVYGPRHRTNGTYGAVFGTFLAQLANGHPVTIVGNGTQTRDFTYVTDVVDAFIKAAESNETGIFNVGSGNHYSVNELVEKLGAKNIEYLPKRPGEPDCTFASICQIKACLNWEPKVSFEKGCEIMKALIPKYKTAPVWTKDKIELATKAWFDHLGEK